MAHNRLLRGTLRVQQGKLETVIKLFEEALVHQRAVFAASRLANPKHPTIAAILAQIGKAHEAGGKLADAVDNYR